MKPHRRRRQAATLTPRHAPAPPVGFVETSSPPLLNRPTLTHSETDGHETPRGSPPTFASFHVVGTAGSVLVTSLPSLSNATHSETDGHETVTSPSDIEARGTALSTNTGADQRNRGSADEGAAATSQTNIADIQTSAARGQ